MTRDGGLAHAHHLRGGRQSEHFGIYAVTKCLVERRPILTNERAGQVVLESIAYLREREWIKLLAFCVMPDHVHLLFVLSSGKNLSDTLASFAKYTALQINRQLQRTGDFWEEGYFDHRCRDVSDAIDRLAYIENNPVRAGLVAAPAEWRFSSAHPSNAPLLDRDWFARNI